MRITQSTVEALAAEASEAGVNTIESINHPGDGRTHYVMAESMTSTYYGARQAAAYICGVLDARGVVSSQILQVRREVGGPLGKQAPADVATAYMAGKAYARTVERAKRV